MSIIELLWVSELSFHCQYQLHSIVASVGITVLSSQQYYWYQHHGIIAGISIMALLIALMSQLCCSYLHHCWYIGIMPLLLARLVTLDIRKPYFCSAVTLMQSAQCCNGITRTIIVTPWPAPLPMALLTKWCHAIVGTIRLTLFLVPYVLCLMP